MAWVVIANLKGAPGDAASLEMLQEIQEQLSNAPLWRGDIDTAGLSLDSMYQKVHAGIWGISAYGDAGKGLISGALGYGSAEVVWVSENTVTQRVHLPNMHIWRSREAGVWGRWNKVDGDADALIRILDTGVPRNLEIDDNDYESIELSLDYRRISGTPKWIAPDGRTVETQLPYLNGAPVFLDAGFRRAQPGADETGMTPQYVLDEWASRMNLGVGFSQIVGWGDSMTTDYGTTGITSIGKIAAELGVTAINQGRSGNTQTEIAWRMGALRWGVTVTGGSIPATGPVACTIDPGPGFRNAYTWDCFVTDRGGTQRSVRLKCTAPAQMGGTPTWTIEQIAGTAAITLLPDTRIRWDRPAGQEALPCTIWVGRNDSEMDPGSINRARTAVDAMIAQHRDPLGRRIVLPVWNRDTEPAGSAQYNLVMAMNAAMKERAGSDWYDLRAAMIRDGLAIVGITPTAADTAAISEDRLPPSLMSDITHPNEPGRTAIGRLVANEIKGRNW